MREERDELILLQVVEKYGKIQFDMVLEDGRFRLISAQITHWAKQYNGESEADKRVRLAIGQKKPITIDIDCEWEEKRRIWTYNPKAVKQKICDVLGIPLEELEIDFRSLNYHLVSKE